jgi:hypothetical protein
MTTAAETPAATRPTGVVVLGMHRSGTSVATGLINLLGVATCPKIDMIRASDNPTGHWESRTLQRVNDSLLRQMGRAWWYPPPAGTAYFEVAARIRTSPEEAGAVMRRVHRARPWVWKDPRACLLVPFWREALGSGFAVVWVIRNPLEVAASLAARNGISTSLGLALWGRYNRLVHAHLGGLPVMVSRFDDVVADPVRWSADALGFLSESGLSVHAQAVDPRRFVDTGLRHSSRTRDAVASEAPALLDLYDVLNEQAASAWTRFAPPGLPEEDPSLEAELLRIGPEQMIRLTRPPGLAEPALSTNSLPVPNAATRKVRSLRRRFFSFSRRIPAKWAS